MSVDPVFFLYITVAIFSYGVQIPLLVHFVRQLDGLTVTAVRNLSLGITMLPILFFVSWSDILAITTVWQTLLLASGFGATGFAVNLSASKYLPVAITSSIRQVVYIGAAMLLGALFLSEYLSLIQIALLLGLAGTAVTISLSKHEYRHLASERKWLGIVLAICGGLGYALSFFFFTELSRSLSPPVAAYFWEVLIGVFALIFLLFKTLVLKIDTLSLPKPKTMLFIAAVSLTTISGTSAYGFAVNHGPYALASGLVTTNIFVVTLIGWLLFKEKMNALQLLCIVVIVGLVVGLRLVS